MSENRLQIGIPSPGRAARLSEASPRVLSERPQPNSAARLAEEQRLSGNTTVPTRTTTVRMQGRGRVVTPEEMAAAVQAERDLASGRSAPRAAVATVPQQPVVTAAAAPVPAPLSSTFEPVTTPAGPSDASSAHTSAGLLETAAARVQSLVGSLLKRDRTGTS